MITHFVEATQKEGKFNWGKFVICQFTRPEWQYQSALPEALGQRLLQGRGWQDGRHFFVIDLQTGEGAMFAPGGSAKADLDKHKIWVCPMFEPFLQWFYKQKFKHLDELPHYVELDTNVSAVAGYRREGK